MGHTARHHTFFEMLGNFSFGDYFKKEAIHFAWEFATKELQLDTRRLYVSVYKDDDEAFEIWHKQEGLPRERIYKFGEKDNFWRMGNTGPCGPCSELFYDLGPQVKGPSKDNVVGGEGDRFIEFWNLVFMQFNEDESGQKKPLPQPSIDTGSGLERLAAILQGVTNNYHTDIFLSLIKTLEQVSGKEYMINTSELKGSEELLQQQQNTAFRVVGDHIRASSFLMAEGVTPSNEGRGYVLRRILRRGIRFARELNPDKSKEMLLSTTKTLIAEMGEFYPELKNQKNLILNHLKEEQGRFIKTLDQGTEILHEALSTLGQKGQRTLPGETAFKLYDTYGFPIDLTLLMAREKGFQVDEQSFKQHQEQAREKAKSSWKGSQISGSQAHQLELSHQHLKEHGETSFTGYQNLTQNQAKLITLSDGRYKAEKLTSGQSGLFIFNETCFYAESGGQVGDRGTITGPRGVSEVLDCQKVSNLHLHLIKVIKGQFEPGDSCLLQVESSHRKNTANNHSATHLLHSALKKTLGDHITQAGSLVEPHRLRFDFTHRQPLSNTEIQNIEDLVNREISLSHHVSTQEMKPEEAITAGALALFGEKYGDLVRVIKMGHFSMELCGGTHVENTSQIRLFKVVSESGVSSGVRRIEALTGDIAHKYLLLNAQENLKVKEAIGATENWTTFLEQDTSSAVLEWIQSHKDNFKRLERELKTLKGQQLNIETLTQKAQTFSANGKKGQLVVADVAIDDRQVLSELSDKIKNSIQTGIVVLVGEGGHSHPIIVAITKDLNPEWHAGKLLKEISATMGGKGGGRPDFAQGAAKDRSQMAKAFDEVRSLLQIERG